MPLRNSPKNIKTLIDLSDLEQIIVDKRNHKRAASKKNRRNRHYEKQLIKNSLNSKTEDEDSD
ncbi:MAG: hypothetical protein ACK5V3_18540 [Bdellovibrionales bacterium]